MTSKYKINLGIYIISSKYVLSPKPGKYTQVDDQDNLRFQMATFYDININDQNDEIRYLSPYSDAWDSGKYSLIVNYKKLLVSYVSLHSKTRNFNRSCICLYIKYVGLKTDNNKK